MAVRVEEYLKEDGSNPYKAWFDSLDPRAAAKVTTAKLRPELGNTSSVKWFEGMGEYVIDWGPGYRVYFGRDGQRVVVLVCGGDKRSQDSDIRKAVELWHEYGKRRKPAPRARG